eukprot:6175152-Pleurochrysis_carterae.AAC.2
MSELQGTQVRAETCVAKLQGSSNDSALSRPDAELSAHGLSRDRCPLSAGPRRRSDQPAGRGPDGDPGAAPSTNMPAALATRTYRLSATQTHSLATQLGTALPHSLTS